MQLLFSSLEGRFYFQIMLILLFFLLLLLATQFSESLEIFHDKFPDTFSHISPLAC